MKEMQLNGIKLIMKAIITNETKMKRQIFIWVFLRLNFIGNNFLSSINHIANEWETGVNAIVTIITMFYY